MPPQDPLLYRLFEVRTHLYLLAVRVPLIYLVQGILVYGTPIKALIHEKFGDGIMSMIDCKVTVDRKENPKGDRVLLTFEYVCIPVALCFAPADCPGHPQWEIPAIPQVVSA